jgi:hypothetical protein
MTERIKELSKDSIVPLSLGLLILLLSTTTIGVWNLAQRVVKWETKLQGFEAKLGNRWSYYMERESWSEFRRINPDIHVPNVKEIRQEYSGIFE